MSDNANKASMPKVLVPVDGSAYTDRVIDLLLRQIEAEAEGPLPYFESECDFGAA